jgi:hypothetical protein
VKQKYKNMQKDNFTEKPISDFNENDTLYLIKKKAGFTYTFEIKFKSFSKGIVSGYVLSIQPNNHKSIWIDKNLIKINSIITGKISNCYTYKEMSGCKWFKKNENQWKCNN